MKDGILVLNKPQNWTSHDCVAVSRNAARVKKVGHGGTLDPMAVGVLPVFIGKATRIMEYLNGDDKTYRCTARLGIVTDTLDIWGKTLETHETGGLTEARILEACGAFRGIIRQIPPKYSALKVNGKKLYEYAREGKEVEIKSREVTIHSFEVTGIDLVKGEVSFDVTCSKGTYIRSICDDLGKMLGCGGAMAALCRTASGIFTLENALSPEALKTLKPEEIEEYLLPVDAPLARFGKAVLAAGRAKFFCSGNPIRWHQVQVDEAASGGMYRVYRKEDGLFLGVGCYDAAAGVLKADKIFAAGME